MFTGIVEVQGTVLSNASTKTANRLIISSPYEQLQTGESVAVNGVCLTLLRSASQLEFDVSPETLKITNLRELGVGDSVNLERAMMANSRFGGHYVSGHIDTTAFIKARRPLEDCVEMTISGFKSNELKYLFSKGSITFEGVSLTINAVNEGEVDVLLIPHTLANTNLHQKGVGDYLNVEFDYLTRIVAHQLGALMNSSIMASSI
jgi:riboflavin synthase